MKIDVILGSYIAESCCWCDEPPNYKVWTDKIRGEYVCADCLESLIDSGYDSLFNTSEREDRK